jgi:hypothetical protein
MRTLQTVATRRGDVTIIHDAEPADLAGCPLSPDGWAMLPTPALRRMYLERWAADPNTRLTLAVTGGVIVGRATIGCSFGRWATLPRVRELAVEIVQVWRRTGLGRQLTGIALDDPAIEDEIIVGFTLPSAWDAEGSDLSSLDYGRLLAREAGTHGFRLAGTDEPEILAQQHAGLLVRTGARVPAAAVDAFERARFQRRPSETVGRQRRPLHLARRALSLLRAGMRAA